MTSTRSAATSSAASPADARAPGLRRALVGHRRPRSRRRRRRRRAHPDPRRRPGRAASRRDRARCACGCIGQETTGAGGFGKALRTVPVVLDIARRARELAAPGTGSSTSPTRSGIVTRALLDDGHRAIGLCNVAIGFQRAMAPMLGVEPERLVVDQVGLNHLTWVRAVWLDGRDVLPELLAGHGDVLAEWPAACRARLLDELGAVPSYYLRYFYAHDDVLAEQLAGDAARRDRRGDRARAAARCTPTRRWAPSRRCSSSAAAPSTARRRRGWSRRWRPATARPRRRHAQRRHDRRARRRRRGRGAGARRRARARSRCRSARWRPSCSGSWQHVAAYERLAVEAAVTGSRSVARRRSSPIR